MARARQTGAALLVTALVLPLPACQEADNPSRPPMVVVTPQAVRGVIAQAAFGNFDTDLWVALEVQLTQRGVVDITVDWTYPDSWIYVYFGQTKCEYRQLANKTCPFLVSSETQMPKPRLLTTGTLDPGSYYLVLYNVPRDPRSGIGSDHSEAVSVQLGLTIAPSGRTAEPVIIGPPRVVSAPRP